MSSDIYAHFNTSDFTNNYNSYIDNNPKINSFYDFLNTITIDKLDIIKSSRDNIDKPKLSNNNPKNINSFLNKLSYNNFDKVTEKIKLYISNFNIPYTTVINNILDYCLLQHTYCDLYIRLIISLFHNLQDQDFNYIQYITNFINTYEIPSLDCTDIYENTKNLNQFLGFSSIVGHLEFTC